jgi:hydrogenase maturation factor
LGIKRREVVVGPKAGIDGAVIDLGDKSLIVSMDPVTGAYEKIGWLAVNINANDIATFGVRPSFMFSSILLPEKTDIKLLEEISSQMHVAAKDLEIAIVGGHCESTVGLTGPIVVGCMLGFADNGKYVTSAGAKAGDKIILTKTAGIEGTAILATDKEKILKKIIKSNLIQDAKNLVKEISIVKDALIAYETGGVNAMHDPTEGGIIGGINEIANASNLGVTIFENKIPIKAETSAICNHFKIDPLQLISSGALIISASPEYSNKIIEKLKIMGIPAKIIGEFISKFDQRIIITKNGRKKVLTHPKSDHLWKALKS